MPASQCEHNDDKLTSQLQKLGELLFDILRDYGMGSETASECAASLANAMINPEATLVDLANLLGRSNEMEWNEAEQRSVVDLIVSKWVQSSHGF